jgi:hypothetical protein
MIVLVAVGVAACLAALTGPTGAIADEVHFDPGSPAGKEYALPLTQARDEGGSNQGQKKGSAATPEEVSLFGAGVPSAGGGGGRDGQGTATETTGTGGGKSASGGDGTGNPNGKGSARSRSEAAVTEATVAGYSFGSGALLVALVLLAGVGLGLLLRTVGRARSS